MRSAFLYSLNHDLTPTLKIIGVVMFGAWTLAYAQILTTCFRQKTYGLPLVCIFLNISWEFIFSFNLVAPGEDSLVWGNRLWFFADCVIVTQVFLYGRQSQSNPWVRGPLLHDLDRVTAGERHRTLQLCHVFQRHLWARDVIPH